MGSSTWELYFFNPNRRSYFDAHIQSFSLLNVGNTQDSDRNLSPPAERPPSTTADPSAETMGLKIIAVSRGKPVFPTSVMMDRFEAGSFEQNEVQKLKEAFEAEFGAENANQSSNPATTTRANAPCDYSVDEGLRPLDTARTVELRCLPLSQLTDDRLVPVESGASFFSRWVTIPFSIFYFHVAFCLEFLFPECNPIRTGWVCALGGVASPPSSWTRTSMYGSRTRRVTAWIFLRGSCLDSVLVSIRTRLFSVPLVKFHYMVGTEWHFRERCITALYIYIYI